MPKPNTSDNSATDKNAENRWLNPFIILGAVGVVVLLVGVQQTSIFGETCYHFGDVSMDTFCLRRELYLGAWLVSGGLLVVGLLQAAKA